MLFGRKTEFAIEAELEVVDGTWYHGRLRFWIAGEPVGDFEDTSDLAGSARWARQFLAASGQRTRADLDKEGAGEVYRSLYGRFFVRGGSEPHEAFNRDPFVLDDVGESSLRDRFSVLAVRRADGSDRMLVRDHAKDTTTETTLPPGSCDGVIGSYCSWVEAQQDKEHQGKREKYP
ncbi:MAG: Imm42 family immunity protein [Polyangiaceae bacterium]